MLNYSVQFSSIAQSCPTVCDPMNHTARQASLSITNSRNSLRLTSIESVMPSSHLILCHPLLLLPPIPPSIRVFSNESSVRMRWPKYWSFSFSIIPSKEIPGLISFIWMFQVASLITTNSWKRTQTPFNWWIDELWDRHIIEYNLTIKRNQILRL